MDHRRSPSDRRPPSGSRPQGERAAPVAGAVAVDLAVVHDDLVRLLGPIVVDLQLEVVEALVHAVGGGVRLVVMIDRLPGRGGVRLEDCARVSRRLTAQLDGQAPAPPHGIPNDYELEVSSPGMTRLLRHKADLLRFVGVTARVAILVDGQKTTVTGVITAVGDDTLTLRTEVAAAKKGAKISAKRLQEGLRELRLADVVQMRLDPTMAEWQKLGERLAAEAAAAGLADEPADGDEGEWDDGDPDQEWNDDDLDGDDPTDAEEDEN